MQKKSNSNWKGQTSIYLPLGNNVFIDKQPFNPLQTYIFILGQMSFWSKICRYRFHTVCVSKAIQKFAEELCIGGIRGCCCSGGSTETVQTHGIQITLYFVKRPAQSLLMLEVRLRYITGLSKYCTFLLWI